LSGRTGGKECEIMILGEQGNKTPKILACGPVGKLLLAIHCSVMMPDSFSTQKIA